MAKKTKRRDHYIPQGYLRGFIDPARDKYPRPLLRFDVLHNKWSSCSPKEVGHRKGFYDYVGVKNILESQTADSAFLTLENDYPVICKEIISNEFTRWSEHLDFLLNFMQMIRARSLLFREQKREAGKNVVAWEIEKVHEDGKTLTLKSMTPSPVSATFTRNRAITEMKEEILKGAAWLKDFDWALRHVDSVDDPFIISEIPLVAQGPCSNMDEAIKHPDTMLIFPLCWRACLFGSLRPFTVKTARLNEEDIGKIRQVYRDTAKLFLLSPKQIW